MTYLLLYTRVDVGPDTTFVLDWALKANYFLALSSGDTTVSLVSRQTLPSSQDRTGTPFQELAFTDLVWNHRDKTTVHSDSTDCFKLALASVKR